MVAVSKFLAVMLLCFVPMAIQGEEVDLTFGQPARQLWFGDGEGDPSNWPEPVFKDDATPWMRIALDFDATAFDVPSQGDSAFAITPWAQYAPLKAVNGFGLDGYFGRNTPPAPNSFQAIVAMGAMLGGTLAGIDYSRIRRSGMPANLARLSKKWFASDTGADVFLNNVRGRGGIDWWYDILPNILACQLADLYGARADEPGEPRLADLCRRAIGRWHEAVTHLIGGDGVPEFAYRAVQLVDGPVAGVSGVNAKRFQPITTCDTGARGYVALHIPRRPSIDAVCANLPRYNGDTFEPDAASGLAYLGLLGYEWDGKPADRQLADWGLTFLDRIYYDPLYECLLPYGAYAAARMNAEYSTKHDVAKLLGNIFAVSSVRKDWGMLGKWWGSTPAFGLIGSRRAGKKLGSRTGFDYGFAMNTMQFAATLAPIPRYDPSTATAIGKYLGHVAHNARIFYAPYLATMDFETAQYIASSSRREQLSTGIPFEGVKFPGPEQSDKPFGTGAALESNRHGAFKTNLGVYSGVYAGAMSALFNITNVPNIYQIDLLATDLPRPNAYPSYLLYNPYDVPKSVPVLTALIRRGDTRLLHGTFSLYNTVTKTVIASGIKDDVNVTIQPHAAVVLVAVPEGDALTIANHHLVTRSGVVVDFDLGDFARQK